jgi:hypothetical protein
MDKDEMRREGSREAGIIFRRFIKVGNVKRDRVQS